eukprot:scaffold2482_cov407-Prasinococcus_capsulatus_cf.AAC.7
MCVYRLLIYKAPQACVPDADRVGTPEAASGASVAAGFAVGGVRWRWRRALHSLQHPALNDDACRAGHATCGGAVGAAVASVRGTVRRQRRPAPLRSTRPRCRGEYAGCLLAALL